MFRCFLVSFLYEDVQCLVNEGLVLSNNRGRCRVLFSTNSVKDNAAAHGTGLKLFFF